MREPPNQVWRRDCTLLIYTYHRTLHTEYSVKIKADSFFPARNGFEVLFLAGWILPLLRLWQYICRVSDTCLRWEPRGRWRRVHWVFLEWQLYQSLCTPTKCWFISIPFKNWCALFLCVLLCFLCLYMVFQGRGGFVLKKKHFKWKDKHCMILSVLKNNNILYKNQSAMML